MKITRKLYIVTVRVPVIALQASAVKKLSMLPSAGKSKFL